MSSDDKSRETKFVPFNSNAMFMYQEEDGGLRAIGLSKLVNGIVTDFMETEKESMKPGVKVSDGSSYRGAINKLRDKLAEQGYPEVKVTTYKQEGHKWVKFEK